MHQFKLSFQYNYLSVRLQFDIWSFNHSSTIKTAVENHLIFRLKKNFKRLPFPEPRNPKEPQNLTLSDARLVGGKLRITLRWVKPTSDVPITFYKVFWSRLVHGPTNDSILVYHRTVLKTPHLDIWRLRSECTYNVNVRNIFDDESSDKHGTSIEFFATGCQKEYDQKEKKYSKDKIIQCKNKSLRSKRYFTGLSLI
ncbi:uncharacterized protein LOC114872275 [Osmia bicornis bicornis]|uniref:uncharacterized protein LOC114872275 n=1 Tax=Osmia bicornis bicornis TaxID=1437191 RepID=UPI0010F717A8|nr:uncharacterized protein LOC114872275 [Osmia bicornis bicornis]